ATGGTTYFWSPPDGLSCVGCDNPLASPSKTTRYVVSSSTPGTCTSTDTVLVTVVWALAADAGTDKTICGGDSVRLDASGSSGSYQWTPTAGLDCPACLNPMASPKSTTLYTLTIKSAGTCQAIDSV